MSHLNL